MPAASFTLNQHVLATDAHQIAAQGINAHEQLGEHQDVAGAVREHERLMSELRQAGIKVEQIPCPPGCQDGVFTANWGLTWNGRALLSRLPNARQGEEAPAEAALQKLGFKTRRASVLFSGQGDAMIIGGNRVIIGGGYRTNPAVAREITEWLGLEVVLAPAKPKRRFGFGPAVRNRITGLRDSYYYDIDLAIGVIQPDLIAVCFEALSREGRAAIRGLRDVEVIPVDLHEARYSLATNLIGIGRSVIMVDNAPKLTADLRRRGFIPVLIPNHELKKSGGGFRCSALSLYR